MIPLLFMVVLIISLYCDGLFFPLRRIIQKFKFIMGTCTRSTGL